MKHNPRLNEKVARPAGLRRRASAAAAVDRAGRAGSHDGPLADWLKKLTGMPAVAMTPKAGAHGELCGLLAIRAALIAPRRGEERKRVLVPESAHGTNPATAAQCGLHRRRNQRRRRWRRRPRRPQGQAGCHPTSPAIMLTNPNTCGLFERDIKRSPTVHAAGGYFYCDGANFNAIVGRVRPGDLGVDAMHINLHKTFSTPHGGGGPGSGPVVLSPPRWRRSRRCPSS
jgi:glycine dehydrogenase subunit 2